MTGFQALLGNPKALACFIRKARAFGVAFPSRAWERGAWERGAWERGAWEPGAWGMSRYRSTSLCLQSLV